MRTLYQHQQQLSLLPAVAKRANESASVSDLWNFALKEICQRMGWACGLAYKIAAFGSFLQLSPSWHVEEDGLEEFIEHSKVLTFAPGVGIPGRVLASGEPCWVADLAQDGNFLRAATAKACGLRSGFAFPVIVGDEIVAVAEFYARSEVEALGGQMPIFRDVGVQLGRVVERARHSERLRHDASHDAMTGLPNRPHFMKRLDQAVAEARSTSAPFAVLFVDLDRFKLVNDSLGHQAGDALLREAGERLDETMRRSAPGWDGRPAVVARFGGDEFVALLPGAGVEEAAAMAERAQAAIAEPFEMGEQTVHATVSIGVTTSEFGYLDAADVLRDADLAMYRAKSLGGARAERFDLSMHAKAVARLALESDLRRAIAAEEFVLYFQPIVALDHRRIVGFEALIRWRHPRRGLVSPAEFIPIAEESGLIGAIGSWVLQESCRAAARIRHETGLDLTVSVNVSSRQLKRLDFVSEVRKAISDAEVDARAIRIEITESTTIDDVQSVSKILRSLHGLGVRVSIDDFGTGYSSLSYLHTLPFDTLKIDRSFVARLGEDKDGGAIVRTILTLASSLQMDVVAEGAESAADIDQLTGMGCQYAQGYYFSRPTDEATAMRLIADQRRNGWFRQ